MKPLIVLIVVFVVATLAIRLMQGRFDIQLAGRIAMSGMLLFTSIGHFAFTKGMSMMLPGFLPLKTELVYLTGILEIVAAVCLLLPPLATVTAWFLVAFFILLLPANFYAAVNHIDYEKATLTGNGLGYLWFRVPLQALFIIWAILISR